VETVKDLVEERKTLMKELQDLYEIVSCLECELEDINEDIKELGIGVI